MLRVRARGEMNEGEMREVHTHSQTMHTAEMTPPVSIIPGLSSSRRTANRSLIPKTIVRLLSNGGLVLHAATC